MNFYYLKLGKSNKLASTWLSGNNPLRRPAAFVYFKPELVSQVDLQSLEDLERLRGTEGVQLLDFLQTTSRAQRKKTVIVLVSQGAVWLLQPDGYYEIRTDAVEMLDRDYWWALAPVKILPGKPLELTEVPAVLAGITSDRWLTQSTFRKIRHWGNIKAICSVLELPLPPEHLQPQELTPARLLECLGSVGLETLVAKLFEAAGCFVPAYRGGTMQGADLFAHNDGGEEIVLGGLSIPPDGRISIQVKSSSVKKKPIGIDCLIALGKPAEDACYDADWLLEQVRRYPPALAWLERSLSWLPAEFLAHYDLHPAPTAA